MKSISQSPWRVSTNKDESTLVNDANGNLIADCGVFGVESRTDAENEANAKLIAAAPELLECLRNLNTVITTHLAHPAHGIQDVKKQQRIAEALIKGLSS